MKKSGVKKLRLHCETLRLLADGAPEGELLKAVQGGAWPLTTVKPYPCQATCLCP